MEVNGQLHDPVALPPGKEHSVPTELEASWAPEKNSQLLPETKPRSSTSYPDSWSLQGKVEYYLKIGSDLLLTHVF
jgi:hypothetical protein